MEEQQMEQLSLTGEEKLLSGLLQKRLKSIDEQIEELRRERRALLVIISKTKQAFLMLGETETEDIEEVQQAENDISEQRIAKIVEFLAMQKSPAKARQIMEYLDQFDLFKGSENPMAHLFAILSQEARDESSKIIRPQKGFYALKKDED